MRHVVRFIGLAAVVSFAGCSNNSTGSTSSGATNGSAGSASASNGGTGNGSATNGSAGSASASNGGTGHGSASNGSAGSASASNGGTGNGSASNGSAGSASATNGGSGNGSASNGSAGSASASNGGTGNGSASNGSAGSASATNGGSGNGSGSNGGTGGATGGQDCNVPAIVSTDLELTNACSEWFIGDTGTTVETGAGGTGTTLTVDPGVTVGVAAGASLEINAQCSLQANGISSSPVTFTATSGQTPGSWLGILFDDGASGSLTSTTVSYAGGADGSTNYPGALRVLGGSASTFVTLSGVTLSGNGANGFVFAGHTAGPLPESGNWTVSDWAAGSYPIVIDANQAGNLPTTITLGTGSGAPAVALDCQDTSLCGNPMTVDHSQTWPSLGMPYVVLSTAGVDVDGASSLATLTIAPPNTIEFVDGSLLTVDVLATGFGALVADGTASSHIAFKSMDAAPAWDAWQGLSFTATTDGSLVSSSLSYCDFSDATGFGATSNVNANQSCPLFVAQGTIYLDGTLLIPASGPSFGLPFAVGPGISNCTFSNYGSCGILTDGITNGTSYGPYDDVTDVCAQVQTGGSVGNVFTPAAGADGGGNWLVSDVCLFDSTNPD